MAELIASTSDRLLHWFDQALGVTKYGASGIQSRQLSAAKLAIHLHSSVYKRTNKLQPKCLPARSA